MWACAGEWVYCPCACPVSSSLKPFSLAAIKPLVLAFIKNGSRPTAHSCRPRSDLPRGRLTRIGLRPGSRTLRDTRHRIEPFSLTAKAAGTIGCRIAFPALRTDSKSAPMFCPRETLCNPYALHAADALAGFPDLLHE